MAAQGDGRAMAAAIQLAEQVLEGLLHDRADAESADLEEAK